jgi:glucose/arabinose dehydrogenase
MRNPQGLAWHPASGVLCETEHGPSGFDDPGGGDEVNYRGDAFPTFRNNFFFGCLRGERIQRVVLTEQRPYRLVREEALLLGEFRRIRV